MVCSRNKYQHGKIYQLTYQIGLLRRGLLCLLGFQLVHGSLLLPEALSPDGIASIGTVVRSGCLGRRSM